MTDIVWEDPPPPVGRRGRPASERISAILVELKAHPGKWALISEDAARTGVIAWRKKGCEARTAPNGLGNKDRGKLYVRWPES